MPHHDEPVRIRERQWFEQDRVDHGKDGRVGANPEGEDQEHAGREPGALAEAARGVAEILQGGVDDRDAAPVAVLFGDALDAAKGQDRLPPGLLGREARALVVVGVHAQVRLDFVGEVAVAPRAVEHARRPPGPRSKCPPHHPSRGARNRARISVVSCHSRASIASCFRPARVSL